MELSRALARRRMVRRYDPDRPVDDEALDAVLAAALRAPSAGFTQGVSLLALTAPADRERFWALTASDGGTRARLPVPTGADAAPHPDRLRRSRSAQPAALSLPRLAGPGAAATPAPAGHEETPPDRWLDGMRTAPVLVLVVTDADAYLDRYAQPDKGWTDRDERRWSAPYWYVDAGMAAMAMLLRAVDLGLGACFFGVPPERVEAVHAAFGVPAGQLGVGVVSLGHEPADGDRGSRGSPARRRRKDPEQQVHRDRW